MLHMTATCLPTSDHEPYPYLKGLKRPSQDFEIFCSKTNTGVKVLKVTGMGATSPLLRLDGRETSKLDGQRVSIAAH